MVIVTAAFDTDRFRHRGPLIHVKNREVRGVGVVCLCVILVGFDRPTIILNRDQVYLG